MDILNTSSVDVPYEDTNYKGRLTDPTGAINDCPIHIETTLVQTKKFEESTYFKFVLPAGMVVSSEGDIQVVIARDDGCKLTITQPIKNNILRIDSAKIQWVKWQGTLGANAEAMEEFMRQMERARGPAPTIPFVDPPYPTNPRWIPDGGLRSPSQPGIYYSSNTIGSTDPAIDPRRESRAFDLSQDVISKMFKGKL
jgi:hypothetical protein